MGITKNTAAAPAQAAAPQTLTLQLAKLNRLVEVNGPMFEGEKAYRFPLEEAQRRLSHADDMTGMPLWKVYKAPAKVEVHSTREAPEVLDAAEAKSVNEPEAKQRVVEIGTDAELAELGLPVADDSDTVQL